MRRAIVAVIVTAMVTVPAAPALAYLKFGVRLGSGVVDLKWSGVVEYFIAERAVPGVSVDQFSAAVASAFATWQAVPSATVRSRFVGLTSAPPGLQDGRSTIGFLDRPELDRVLGATSFLLDAATGAIVEADIFFNTRFDWSTSAAGVPGRVDVESVALHEIGHLLGLGHSALGETEAGATGRRVIGSAAVMFPIALTAGSIADRQLLPDDVAGIADLYPASPGARSSSISGRVTKNGVGVYGAHVVAFNLATGDLVGGFVLMPSGEFVIGGLVAGAYLVRAEPLDDAETDSFLSGTIDVEYRATYSPSVVIVPDRGSPASVEVQVRPK